MKTSGPSPPDGISSPTSEPQPAVTSTAARSPHKPLLLYVPTDVPDERMPELIRMLEPSVWAGAGVGIGGDDATGRLAAGPAHLEDVCRKIRLIRSVAPAGFVIQAAAGIHEPIDALRAMEAGADQLLLNSGFVYAGPGLPKRIHDALLHEKVKRQPEPEAPPFWRNW